MGCSLFDCLFPRNNEHEKNKQESSNEEVTSQDKIRMRQVQETNLKKTSKWPLRANSKKSKWGVDGMRDRPAPRPDPAYELGFGEVEEWLKEYWRTVT